MFLSRNKKNNVYPCKPQFYYCIKLVTGKSNNRYQNIMEKRRNCSSGAISPLFHNIFNISLNFRSQITYSFIKCCCSIYCIRQFRKSDISKYPRGSLGFRDNENRLYLYSNQDKIHVPHGYMILTLSAY